MQETELKPVEAEYIDITPDGEISTREQRPLSATVPKLRPKSSSTTAYIWLPLLFLLVTLLGGLRFGVVDNAFIFNPPPLICLVFAAITVLLYLRSGMISVGGWLDESRGFIPNAAGVGILLTLFAATVQLYNSVLPESGLTFWIVGFCFFWTLWNNLFANLPSAKLLRSVLALFGLAFAVKYLLLTNVTAAPDGSWWRRLFDNPGKEAFTWLLDLPKYGAATGYVQFATLCLYMIGLYLTPARTDTDLPNNER